MSIDVDALLNFYQVAFLDSRLVMNNKNASNENVANEQAIESLAISTNNTSNTRKEIRNE